MPVSYNTFERLKDKGLANFKSGDYGVSRLRMMRKAGAKVMIVTETNRRTRRSAGEPQELTE